MTLGGKVTVAEIIEQAARIVEADPDIDQAELVKKTVLGYAVYKGILQRLICIGVRDMIKAKSVCPDCKKEIDPDVCWCGSEEESHGHYNDDHSFVPMGCRCFFDTSKTDDACDVL